MNPLLTTKAETFRSGTDNLEFYHNRLIKLTNGVLLFCSGGEAEITIDLYRIRTLCYCPALFFRSDRPARTSKYTISLIRAR